MINIIEKHKCCGCGACVQRCPKKCISLFEDIEGFLYPKVDKQTCVDCGICESVCPVIHPYEKRSSIQMFASINTNETIREQSSSGGIFTAIAEKIIDEGGVVFGARFDNNWNVIIDYTEAKEDLKTFRGSKYVQAIIGESYKQCELFLKSGRKVLYSGTPCQIAGLKHFIRKDYDTLFTVDFICHGVPSPRVWRNYLKEITKPDFVKSICKVFPRNICDFYSLESSQKGNKSIVGIFSPRYCNAYMKAFLNDLILRPSCYQCVAKEASSMSDVTIADFWGIWEVKPKLFDDKGTSLIIMHSDKASQHLLESNIVMSEVSYEESIKFNSAYIRSTNPHAKREEFWFTYNNCDESLSEIVSKYTIPKIWTAVKLYVRNVLRRFKNRYNYRSSSMDLTEECKIVNISFREKKYGWRNYGFLIELERSKN